MPARSQTALSPVPASRTIMATAAPDGFAVFECRHDNISKDLMVAQGTPQVEIAQTLCQLFGLPPQYAGRLRVSVHGTDAVLSSKIPSGVVIDVDSPGAHTSADRCLCAVMLLRLCRHNATQFVDTMQFMLHRYTGLEAANAVHICCRQRSY